MVDTIKGNGFGVAATAMTEFDFIETPESVELQRRLAGIGTRFIAGLLDTLILIGLYLVLALAFLLVLPHTFSLGPARGGAAAWSVAILTLMAFGIYWGYFVFFELRTNGQSPGKKNQRIRVVKAGGGPITFIDIAIRNLLRVVDGIGLYAVAGFVMFLTRKGQRLGDLAAGTVVALEGGSDYSARSDKRAKPHREEEASPQALRVTGLTPEEYRVLSSYWARRSQLSLEARHRILLKVIGPILRRSGQSPPADTVDAMEQRVHLLMCKAAAGQPPAPTQRPPSEETP